jgi:hypothetical protein
MNRKELEKNIGQFFKLRPIPLRINADGRSLPPIDYDWRLDDVQDNPARIRLRNVSTHHSIELESDNVQERRSPNFLLLRCQLSLRHNAVEIEPIAKGSPIGLQKVTDRFVSLNYVEQAGITARLRAEGYALGWVRADEEATRVDLEGWEHVEEVARDGSMVRFKVKDPVVGYLVLLKKPRVPTP